MASHSSVADPGCTSKPCFPSSMSSGTAPARVATMGVPASMASRTALEQPSCREVNAKTSIRRR